MSIKVNDLKLGDKVLWDDRKEPLRVTETEDIHVGSNVQELASVQVTSKRGTNYILHESQYGSDPKVKRETTLSEKNPSGYESAGYARDLRFADADGPLSEEEWQTCVNHMDEIERRIERVQDITGDHSQDSDLADALSRVRSYSVYLRIQCKPKE